MTLRQAKQATLPRSKMRESSVGMRGIVKSVTTTAKRPNTALFLSATGNSIQWFIIHLENQSKRSTLFEGGRRGKRAAKLCMYL